MYIYNEYLFLLYDPYYIYAPVKISDFKFTPKGCRLNPH